MDLGFPIYEAALLKLEAVQVSCISEIYLSRAFERYIDCSNRLLSW